MKIKILALCALCTMLQALDTNEIKVEIEQMDKKRISFAAKTLQVGQSGVILSQNNDRFVIIASVVISEIVDNKAYGEYSEFEGIKQKYLPTPRATPKVGDSIIFNSFYNRAIAIAPNQEHYNKILALKVPTSFMHIDLFGAFLAKDSINDPKPKHFKAFCNAYSIGLVYILASNGINVLDCQSFSVLEVLPFGDISVESSKAPFFSRIADINTGSLASKFRSKNSRQYLSYYDDLLKAPLESFQQRLAK